MLAIIASVLFALAAIFALASLALGPVTPLTDVRSLDLTKF